MRPKLEAMTDDELISERARLEVLVARYEPSITNGRAQYYDVADLKAWESRIEIIYELLENA